MERWVPSACVLCSNGCAMDVAVTDGRIVGVRGRAGERINHGRLGPKGLYGWQANHARDRLTDPLVRGSDGELRPADWDTAMDAMTARSARVLVEHGPRGLAFHTSGQLFAEEYYTQAVIARGGIGTPHLDGNTRLCTATADRRAARARRVRRPRPGRPGVPQGRGVRAAGGAGRRRLPAAYDHRSPGVSLAHPHQDRPRPRTRRGGTARVGRAVPRRRQGPRHPRR